MKQKIKKKKPLDPMSVHEALDRSHICQEMVSMALCSHSLIRKNKKLFKIAMKAEDALAELYCEVGRIWSDNDDLIEKLRTPDHALNMLPKKDRLILGPERYETKR